MAQYVLHYLTHHAWASCQDALMTGTEAEENRINIYLSLVCDPDFRTLRYNHFGPEAAFDDMSLALRVIYNESLQTLSFQTQSDQASDAFNRLMEANIPGSLENTALLDLEQSLRSGQKSISDLEQFLF